MSAIQEFESAFAEYVGARHAIALTNGTVTLEVALRAMDVGPGDTVQTTPLTMSATTIAILNVGATPRYHDVDPDTWLMKMEEGWATYMPVSLYGLHMPGLGSLSIDDAAQTLRPHSGAAFTSYSFQSSKVLALGEGGMLVTDHEFLAKAARSIASLGYDLDASSSRISKDRIKDPRAVRHVRYPAVNARMNDYTAERGMWKLRSADELKGQRAEAVLHYCGAIIDTAPSWLRIQRTPSGWSHDYWAFAAACDTPERAIRLADACVKHGAERPYGAWRITYTEPCFTHLAPPGTCPTAENLQPRILAFQTNNVQSAERNARALRLAIQEIGA